MKAPRLVVATGNPGKAEEYRRLLRGLRLSLLTLADVPGLSLPPETGETFEENALLKASAVARSTGLPCLADDSGLCVDGLGGRPGVHSARYGGPNPTDRERRRKLLEELSGLPAGERTARFVCVVALALPDGRVWTARGECSGVIAFREVGEGGFGYDPLFLADDLGGRSFGQASSAEKDSVSHRGRALARLLPVIRDLWGEAAPAAAPPADFWD